MQALTILNFHGIGRPHAGVDASEAPYWVSEAQFREIVDRVCTRDDAADFVWTFDDGNKSDIAIAAPYLRNRGQTGRFFVLVGRLDHPHYLSRQDVRDLGASGMIVGLHGRHHVDWRRCDPAALADEVDSARADLEAVVQAPVDEVAIPFGAYNGRVIAHLKRQKFQRIHTSDGGRAGRDRRIWNRSSIRGTMSSKELDTIIEGKDGLATRARRLVSTQIRRHL